MYDYELDLRTSTVDPGVVIVTAAGEIDLANRAQFAEAIAAALAVPGLRALVCDLDQVGFLACAGIATLVDARSELDGRGALLRVVTSDQTVLRVLRVTGQLEPLAVRHRLADALVEVRDHLDGAP